MRLSTPTPTKCPHDSPVPRLDCRVRQPRFLGNGWLWRLAGLLIAAGLLTACQPPAWPSWPTGIWPSSEPTPTPALVTTELHFATWEASEPVNDYFRARVSAYGVAAPDTHVALQVLPNYATRLRTALDSDRPPDVIRLNAFALTALVEKGLIAPLPEPLAARTNLSPLLRAMGEVDGNLYCVPHEINTLALVYNPALFDAAQLAYPTAEWSWETLRSAAETLTDATAGRYGLILPADFSRWLPFLYQAGGSVTDAGYTTMTINSPEGATALQFYTDLVLEGMAATPATAGNSWAGEAFAQGHAAMVIEGNWIIPYLAQQAPALGYAVVPLPTGPVGKATVAFVNCYAIAAGAADIAAAGQFIEFLTSADSQRQWLPLTAALPVQAELQRAWSTMYPTQLAFIQGLAYAYPWRFYATFQPVVDQVNGGIQQVYDGFILADSVLVDAETTGNEQIQP